MEPLTKKRKLAPKLSPSLGANLNPRTAQPAPRDSTQLQARVSPEAQPPNHHNHDAYSQHASHQQPASKDHSPSERHDFEAFARHLQDAAMLIQRQAERPAHPDVSVLMLRWEDDHLADEHLLALEHCFQKKYGFQTQRWHIPAVHNPSIKLGVQIASFLENPTPNHLFVIYYHGHGYLDANGHLYWACNAADGASRLKWDGIRCLFEDAQSDILLLLDTCSLPDPPMTGSHGAKQAIAARSPGSNACQEPSVRSFTSNLVQVLHRMSSGPAFSVSQLYDELVSLKRQQLAEAHKLEEKASSYQKHTAELPILSTLAPSKGKSLMLYPVSDRIRPSDPHNSYDRNDSDLNREPERNLIDPETVVNLSFDEARVLVCTTFVGDASPDMSFFNQWLQRTRLVASNIAVEGMFLGPPTMLLISMPHAVWSVVQHDKVCCFLGYISSHNMLHLYQRLVSPPGSLTSAKEGEECRIVVQAQPPASATPSHHRREGDLKTFRSDKADYHVSSTETTPYVRPPLKPKEETEGSAEMQEAAEQLKALSHVRHRSDEDAALIAASAVRRRTTLPDGSPKRRRSDVDGIRSSIGGATNKDSAAHTGQGAGSNGRRTASKQETQCSHCSHAPFRDSSSLRKHIAAAHTRPFPCAFSFAGCTSTFGSKNEWKRHIASQHLCLQYYRCSACPQRTVDGKANEFNRKDLFTQHLRRMHAPYPIKRSLGKVDGQLQSDWDAHVKEMQQSCLVTRRHPPQKSACPKPDCPSTFEGPGAWDEWTEHVGRHMEQGDGDELGVDSLLSKWAVDEHIVESKSDGTYRLLPTTASGSTDGGRPALGRRSSTALSWADTSLTDGDSTIEVKHPGDAMQVDS